MFFRDLNESNENDDNKSTTTSMRQPPLKLDKFDFLSSETDVSPPRSIDSDLEARRIRANLIRSVQISSPSLSHLIFFAYSRISEWYCSLTFSPWPDTISSMASLSSDLFERKRGNLDISRRTSKDTDAAALSNGSKLI